MMWYMWCGENSPLFGKMKMTTFERYFIDDKSTHHEEKFIITNIEMMKKYVKIYLKNLISKLKVHIL